VTAESSRRVALLAAGALILVGVVAADAAVRSSPSSPSPSSPASAIVAGATASSSAWYCPGLAGVSPGAVLVTNPGRLPVTGTVHVAGSNATSTTFAAPPGQQVAVAVPQGAVTVSVHGGGVGVLEEVSGAFGATAAPCASSPAGSWYFAAGSTAAGDLMEVAVANPLATPAVVDISFVSASAGTVVPPAYQGIPLGPGAYVVEYVMDHVPNDPSLATEVTALSGSVVAGVLQEWPGPGSGGASFLDGTTAPGSHWAFARNQDVAGGNNVFTVFNPTSSPATVTVALSLSQGRAAPFVLHVAPHSASALSASSETRIPGGSPYGITFSTRGRARIVVARLASSNGRTNPAVGLSSGQPGGVSRWLVPPVPAGQSPSALAVIDMAPRPVRVTVEDFPPTGKPTPLPGADAVVVVPGTVLVVSSTPATPVGWAPVEVAADGPVAVQLDPSPAAPPGTSPVVAWPLLSPVG
jgi:hypothetical protein